MFLTLDICMYLYVLVLAFSRDFSNFQVLGLLDFFSPGTTGPSRSLGPVLSGPGTFPGLPGTSQDKIPLYIYALKSFDCEP